MWSLIPWLLRADLHAYDIPYICGGSPHWGLILTMSLPLLPFSMWPSLYVFTCRRSVLPVFRRFSEEVAPYVVVVLICSWEEVRTLLLYHLS